MNSAATSSGTWPRPAQNVEWFKIETERQVLQQFAEWVDMRHAEEAPSGPVVEDLAEYLAETEERRAETVAMCDQLVAERDALTAQMADVRKAAEAAFEEMRLCPCCEGWWECEDECTLAEDAPEGAEELDRWREVLRPLRQALESVHP